MLPSEAPKRLMLSEVPRYIRTHYGYDVSRMTIYNWMNRGVSGVKLKVIRVRCRRRSNYGRYCYHVTTTAYVDAFMAVGKPELH